MIDEADRDGDGQVNLQEFLSICVLEFGCVSIFSLASIFANEFLHLFTSVPRRRAYVRLYCRRAYVRQPPLEGRRPGRGPTDQQIYSGVCPSPHPTNTCLSEAGSSPRFIQ